MIPYRVDNPVKRLPFVNYALILINVLVFMWEMLNGFSDGIFIDYGMIPRIFWENPLGNIYRLMTSCFLHGGWVHIVGNMIFLWTFGDNVEDVLGHWRYLCFYLCAGFIGAILHSIFNPLSLNPLIGASGAISGVIALYLMFFPKTQLSALLLFVFDVRLPAWTYILFWIFMQFAYGLEAFFFSGQGEVAYFAHIGGIVCGLLYAMIRKNRIIAVWKKKSPPPRRNEAIY